MENPVILACPSCGTKNRIPRERLGQNPTCGKCRSDLLPDHPVTLDSQGLQRQIRATQLPLVVDFWASWCGPCKMMAPAFAEAATRLNTRAVLAKVNTESEQSVSAQMGIRSIPTMVLFAGGREVDRVSGAMDAGRIVAWVESHLGRV